MRASLTGVSLLLIVTASCSAKSTPPKQATEQDVKATQDPGPATPKVAKPSAKASANDSASCARTLCIGGPGALDDDANRDLGELCRRAPGVVRHCEGELCQSVWAQAQWRAGLDALIGELDQNADGKLDDSDKACTINLAGWSSGGVIAAEDLPKALREDGRVSESRAVVEHLLAIAPWAPKREQIDVANNVRKAWIYRHTSTPEGDCSKAFEGGPWLSPAPVCGAETTCLDYDFSLTPELAYLSRRGARSGNEIGHCNIVAVLAKIGLDNLARGIEAPAELVPHYSDGTHGGRKVDHSLGKPDPAASAN